MKFDGDKPASLMCGSCKYFKVDKGSTMPYKCNVNSSLSAFSGNEGYNMVTKSTCEVYEAGGKESEKSSRKKEKGGKISTVKWIFCCPCAFAKCCGCEKTCSNGGFGLCMDCV